MHVMVAGVGNVFLGDDGFGVAVAGRLAGAELPGGARACDYGIRGVHLAHELMNGYDGLVLIDAVQRGGPPGTVYILEPVDPEDDAATPALDAHDMAPATVLALLRRFGVRLPWVTVIGCEPAVVGEGMGLSPPVLDAVDEAVRLVPELLAERLGGNPAATGTEKERRTGAMHEIGLCEGILEAVEGRAQGRRVTGVTVRIGEQHAVVGPALAQSFALVAAGTVADGAAVELITVPGDEFTLLSIRVAGDTGAGGGDRVPGDSR